MNEDNYYAILGVSQTATTEEIKAAYQQKTNEYHPNNFHGDKEFARQQRELISEAYSVLSNPITRNEYDKPHPAPTPRHTVRNTIIIMAVLMAISGIIAVVYLLIPSNVSNDNAGILSAPDTSDIPAMNTLADSFAFEEESEEEPEETTTQEETATQEETTEKIIVLSMDMSEDDADALIKSMFDDINNAIKQQNADNAYEIIKLLQADIKQVSETGYASNTSNVYPDTIRKKYENARKELIKVKQNNCDLFIKLFTDKSLYKNLTDFFPMSQITNGNKKTIYPVLAKAYMETGKDSSVENILRDMINPLNEVTLSDMIKLMTDIYTAYPQSKKAYSLINLANTDYDIIKPFENNVAIVGKLISGITKYGLIDKDGKVIIEPKYDVIEGFLEGLCAVRLNGKWGFVNISGTLVIPAMYDELYDPPNDNDFFAYAKRDPEHTKRGFYYGYALVCSNGYWGFVNSNNVPLGEGFVYGYASNFSSDGIASVRKFVDGETLAYSGLLRNDGNYIIKPQVANSQGYLFRMIRPIYEGFAGANWLTSNKILSRGIINSSGQVVHILDANKYDLIQDFREGLAIVVKNYKIGFVNINGNEIVPPVFDTATVFINGLAKVSQSGKYGIVKSDGYYALKPEYDEIHDFSSGYAVIKKDGKYGFIDSRGKIVCVPKFDMAGKFSNGFLPVQIGNSWGLVDTVGNLKVPAIYEMIGDYQDGLAPAKFGGKWGYIDSTGYFVIEPVFYSATAFNSGVACIKTENNKLTLIKK